MISNNLRRTLRGDTVLNRAPGNVDAFQDGIHLDFVNNYHYTKAAGAAPNVAPLTSLFTFTRAGTATFLGRSGLIETAAANVPRIEYDGNGRCLGLLMEVARTNLCLQSQDFSTGWINQGTTEALDTIAAPDGTVTADTIIESAGLASHYMQSPGMAGLTATTVYTASAFVKRKERGRGRIVFVDGTGADGVTATYNLDTGIISSTSVSGAGTLTASGITSYPNGWYRVWVAGAMNNARTTGLILLQMADDTNNTFYTGDGTSGQYMWGAQLEAGPAPSSYIPTTTVAVTRPVDVCFRTLGGEFVQGLGTMVAELKTAVAATSGNQFVARFSDASFGNAIAMSASGFFGVSSAAASVFDGGANDPTALVNGQSLRGAVAFATNNLGVSLNGGVVYLDTAATMPTGITRLDLCHDHIQAVSNSSQGLHFRRLHYFPERRSNGYLQQWSRP